MKDGVLYGYAENIRVCDYAKDSYSRDILMKCEAGKAEYIMIEIHNDEVKNTTFEVIVEYLGDVTDIIFDDNLENMVLGADIQNEYYTYNGYYFLYLSVKPIIKFSCGKQLAVRWDADARVYKPVTAGEVDFEVHVFDFKKVFTAEVVEITDYVESVTIPDELENYTAVQYFDGEYKLPEVSVEGVIVNFTDGTSTSLKKAENDAYGTCFTAPNGRSYYLYINVHGSTISLPEIDVSISGTSFETVFSLKFRKATLIENTIHLYKSNKYIISHHCRYFENILSDSDMRYLTKEDIIFNVKEISDSRARAKNDLYYNIYSFINYYS